MAKDTQTSREEAAEQKAVTPATGLVYKGLPPYGTEFLAEHRLTKADLHGVLISQGMEADAAKEEAKAFSELVFSKDNDFRVSAKGVHPEVLAFLDKDPAFKVERG
jgi:hypothetical protein